MKTLKINNTFRFVAAVAFAFSVAALGSHLVHASEVNGTVSSDGGSNQSSYTDGGLMASVAPADSATQSTGGTNSSTSGTNHNVGAHRHPVASDSSSSVQSDGSLAQSNDYTGTGGGYDARLDSYLSSLRPAGQGGTGMSAREAVAYNTSLGSMPNTVQTAAVANSKALNNGQIWTTVVLGLALLGLAGYAVNAYLAFRRGL